MTFIGVALDQATREADRKLADYLQVKAGITFAPEELEYERVIDRLVTWRRSDGYYLARTTPYAYVVSELLGANVEPLATYISAATGHTTYHAYFVVNRKDFPTQPTLLDVQQFVTSRKERARFAYHSQFSTSSYFLPSLFFRSHQIFHMPEPTGSLAAIASDRIPENSSTKLIERVAGGQADIAAVWDGAKADAPASIASRVFFVQLPAALPNDFLVASTSLDVQLKDRIKTAIRSMKSAEIRTGDFQGWQGITEATDARLALAELRDTVVHQRTAPVTVDVQVATPASAGTTRLVEAARQAIRLSGTEFVVFDPDFHGHVDFRWLIEPIHDGAVVLRSSIPGADIEAQEFRLSFGDAEDLTQRFVTIIQSRLHRVRYVWPFSAGAPIVLRDNVFALTAGASVRIQRISWIDPERDNFVAGPAFTARIRNVNFYRYELDPEDFARHGAADLDPMSNIGYRVILARLDEERLLFRALTVALVALFAAAGAAAGWALLKKPARVPVFQ